MPDTEGKLTRDELRARWEEEPGISFWKEIIRQLQSEETEHRVNWENLKVDVKGKEYIWEEFEGVNELEKISNSIRDLRGINLSNVSLEHAYLFRDHLVHADPGSDHLEHADLRLAHLEHAYLRFTHLEHARLFRANLGNANLYEANLEHADLRDANLEKANLTDAHFKLKSWWWRIKEIFKKTDTKSPECPTLLEGAELKNVKLDSDPVLYRELLDEQYLDRFSKRYHKTYIFWLLTSDCGRNIPMLFGWSIFIGILFGLVFADFSSPELFPGFLRDFLDIIDPKFLYNSFAWWKPFYLSFVTMTTLGVASVEPANDAAFWWHTAQNLFGYVWLGYLIAVLGSKLTRRSA